ncbi:glucokinase [Sulfitobacter sp. SK012]|uniref:glucokinase n=1 Tax=Sulfitobacter sp. SK012 TaxID=1389005 RepID=UPI000E0AC40C|nr:glucokinase [Sulfitobacter sp. SK012]AXI47992.1 glucokinase [Sulfitobacter sp. SK012]
MTLIIADVGGTNTRMAMVPHDTKQMETVRHFDNAKYATFYDVLGEYLADAGDPKVRACSVAMAGPVLSGQGALTNRDWMISVEGLKSAAQCGRAVLINDLSALGYALGNLPEGGTDPIMTPETDAAKNGQSLVVGLGTGFNVCPVRVMPSGASCCLEVEAGHTELPRAVIAPLEAQIGNSVVAFPTVEDLFSGRGLGKLYDIVSGHEGSSGKDVVTAYRDEADPHARQVLTLYAQLLRRLCAELALQYMPRDGIYLAGSVARGVLSPEFLPHLTAPTGAQKRFGDPLGNMPMSLILEDAAALHGCIAAEEMLGG